MGSLAETSILLGLAPELLLNILSFLDPKDLVCFGLTCSTATAVVAPQNQVLWRSSFLQIFDDPRPAWKGLLPTARAANAKVEAEWNWHHEARKRYAAIRAVTADNEIDRRADYEENAATVLNMVETARRTFMTASDEPSLNIAFLYDAFDSSTQTEQFIHDFHPDRSSPSLKAQLAATSFSRPLTRSMVMNQQVSESASRLHILHGLTFRERCSKAAKGAARAFVYDWFLTGPLADYGPYRQDGSGEVNWKVLEAIYSVIVRNFELVTESRIHFPQGFQHNVPLYRGLSKGRDWARVEGPWLGTYSFLDYTDLFYYNVAHRPGPRPPLDDHVEACGDLMRLELKLDDSLENDSRLQTDLPICDDLPKLHFSGTSQGHESHARNAVIAVRGFVALGRDGKSARWRFLISYGGEDQWQLEGVQPGGPRTGGIFGLWSHCDHEANGPIGPFCYYPMELCPPCPMSEAHSHMS